MIKKENAKKCDEVKSLIARVIELYGEDINRDGLKETPKRVAKMYQELLGGYNKNVDDVIKTFDSNGFRDVVTATNIDFYSLCEHHMVPFFGKIHIGYIPNGKILGLSKFARIVEIFSRRLQTQENLTNQIAEVLETKLHPKGFIVHIEAEHLCVSMRGVKKKRFTTRTTIIRGLLNKKSDLVNQFFKDVRTNFDRKTN